jgi:hypothetical protein
MICTQPSSAFAVQATSPWQPGPSINLPAGEVLVRGQGQILLYDGFIIGILISPSVCIAAYSRVGTTQNLLVLEQLVGFLHAHEELVLRTHMRCPAKLFAQTRYQPPQYQPQQCLIYWIRSFLAQHLESRPPRLPRNVVVPGTALVTLKRVAEMLRGAEALVKTLITNDVPLLGLVAPDVFRAVRRCEFAILKMQSMCGEEPSAELREVLAECDRSLRSCVLPFPSYELLPQSLARLL